MSVVLIIDDQKDVRMSAAIALNNQGLECLEADSPEQALSILKSAKIDLILLDMNFSLDTSSGEEGLTFLSRLQSLDLSVPVIVMTGWASVDIAVKSMQMGAVDFIEKPWQNTRFVSMIKQHLNAAQLLIENERFSALSNSAARSDFIIPPDLQSLLESAKRAAISDVNILITGENGSGKSLLAKHLHLHSKRASARFVSVNLGAVPETLFESELFGHKKGAFTDAKEKRLGRFDIASNGTLFLDEIGTLPMALQSKLLRVLETGEYEVLGSSQTQTSNARIISATNAQLDRLVDEQGFRRDLLFRLNTIELHIPPLRERKNDIVAFAEHLAVTHGLKYQGKAVMLTPDAVQALINHPWPGNVRELSHCLERAIIMSDSAVLDTHALGLPSYASRLAQGNKADSKTHDVFANPTSIDSGLLDSSAVKSASVNNEEAKHHSAMPLLSLAETEKRAIISAIQHFNGRVLDAAEFLGVSKSALYRRIEKLEIDLSTICDNAAQ